MKQKHKEGLTSEEIDKVLEEYETITREKFNEVMGVNTVMIKEGETLYFPCDVERTIRCILEKREPNMFEID